MAKKEKYRWETPHEWLAETSMGWDGHELYSAMMDMAKKMTPDDLQDIFQPEMDQAGYFKPLKDGE